MLLKFIFVDVRVYKEFNLAFQFTTVAAGKPYDFLLTAY